MARPAPYRSVGDLLGVLGRPVPEHWPAGAADREIAGPASLEEAVPGTFTFATAKLVARPERLEGIRPTLLIAHRDALALRPIDPDVLVLEDEDPRLSFIRVLRECFAVERPAPGIHPTAVVEDGAQVDPSATVGPQCWVAAGCVIGAETILHAGVRLYPRTVLGRRVIVMANAVLGAEGYGFEQDADGALVRFPQLGGVRVADDVEIGACTCIDRGALDDTIIGARTKIDNLVHIAHNAVIGEDCAVIANAMVAGSVVLEDRAWVAPSAAIRQKLTIGEGALVGLGAVVVKDVAAGAVVAGNPARPR